MFSRVAAAVVGLSIVLPCLVYFDQMGLELVCGIVLLIAADEYVLMAVPNDRRARGVFVLVAAGVFAVAVWLPHLLVAMLSVAALVVLLTALFGTHSPDEAVVLGSRLLTGLIYIPVLLSFLPAVRGFPDGLGWILLILVVTWAGDTGAYFSGRAFGKRKLMERISPKKTWAGVVGGVLAGVAAACVIKMTMLTDLPWIHAVGLGVLIDVAGVLGDLVESMFKRAHGVKDSGWIMPGHGGILDRIDSLLFSAPVAWIYATTCGLV